MSPQGVTTGGSDEPGVLERFEQSPMVLQERIRGLLIEIMSTHVLATMSLLPWQRILGGRTPDDLGGVSGMGHD
jgi:hypothetical protein